MKKILVLDVCGTLFYDDTTLGFISFLYKKNNFFIYILLLVATNKYSPFNFFIKVFERLSKRHILKYFLIHLLRHQKKSDIDNYAKDYSKYLLKNRKIDKVWNIIDEKKKNNWELILASASIDPVISNLAKIMSASNYVSSTLAVEDGFLTGYYSSDITGKKTISLLDIGYDFQYYKTIVISDNLSDKSLLESASQAIIVVHKLAHLKRWGAVKSNTVFLEDSH